MSMNRYVTISIVALGLVPLALVGYRSMSITGMPVVSGAAYWVTPGEGTGTYDLHVKVFGSKPDSCFEAVRAKVAYDSGTADRGALITVVPELKKSRFGGGGCTQNPPLALEGVLQKVPAGPYRLRVVGKGVLLEADVSLPRQGAIPEYFAPPPDTFPKR